MNRVVPSVSPQNGARVLLTSVHRGYTRALRGLDSKWTKVAIFLLCLVPLANIVRRGFAGDLTANPIEFLTHKTGDWTIRLLLITLAITPLRALINRPQVTRFRRMLGLFAFFYATLHFTVWLVLDKAFDWRELGTDILKRPFVTMGMLGLLSMTPLAITSTAGWVRRLTFKRWQKLHRLVYLATAAGAIHYYWLVKSDIRLPLLYASIFAILMSFRAVKWARSSKPVTQTARPLAGVR